MLIAGLTGGIASGKSLVARVFKDLGAQVIDADKIVHELLEPGQRAWQEVLAYFGAEIQLPDKTIDRRKLGELVFNDPAKRDWLNKCLHPKVFEAYVTRVNHLRARQPGALVLLDAALLVETGYHRKMDKVIVVYASEEDQQKRLMERDRFTAEQATARIRSQMPLAEKRQYADYVIDNQGTREETERQARELFARLNDAAREKE